MKCLKNLIVMFVQIFVSTYGLSLSKWSEPLIQIQHNLEQDLFREHWDHLLVFQNSILEGLNMYSCSKCLAHLFRGIAPRLYLRWKGAKILNGILEATLNMVRPK